MERRSWFVRLKKVKLPELFVWWISLVTPLTEGCAQSFDSSGTLLPPPYGSQQVLIRFLPSTKKKRCAEWQRLARFSAHAALLTAQNRKGLDGDTRQKQRIKHARVSPESDAPVRSGIRELRTLTRSQPPPPAHPQLVQRKNAWRRNSHWSGELICFFLEKSTF